MLGLTWLGAQQRDPEEYARFLENRERVERMEVARVVGALGLKPGQLVVDLGSGSGLFTRALARAVAPEGTAYAVDIDAELLKIVESSAKRSALKNLKTVLAAPDDPKLPQAVDVIFICDTFHHLPDKPTYARTLSRYVKPGGRVAVIDFTNDWPGGHDAMRYTPDDLDRWMTDAGFARDQSFDFPKNSFFVTYKKPQ
jgi:arsenite methyltransferase